MNKEILESQGWKFKWQYSDTLHFEKGNTWLDNGLGAFLEFNEIKSTIKITTTDEGFNSDGPNCSIKFNGKCANVGVLKMITSLIDLKC